MRINTLNIHQNLNKGTNIQKRQSFKAYNNEQGYNESLPQDAYIYFPLDFSEPNQSTIQTAMNTFDKFKNMVEKGKQVAKSPQALLGELTIGVGAVDTLGHKVGDAVKTWAGVGSDVKDKLGGHKHNEQEISHPELKNAAIKTENENQEKHVDEKDNHENKINEEENNNVSKTDNEENSHKAPIDDEEHKNPNTDDEITKEPIEPENDDLESTNHDEPEDEEPNDDDFDD